MGYMWLTAGIAKVKVRGTLLVVERSGEPFGQSQLDFMNDRGEGEAGGGRGEARGHPVFSMVTK